MGAEEVIDDNFTDDLCGDIYNLSATLFNLMELNSSYLGEIRKGKLRRMKQLVFDTLVSYIDCIAIEELSSGAEEDIADYTGDEEDEY